jgi:hypothetical protein
MTIWDDLDITSHPYFIFRRGGVVVVVFVYIISAEVTRRGSIQPAPHPHDH